MKKLRILLAGLLGLTGTATAQNNALAQLQAKGVTETGGSSAYAHYIVRLDGDGKVASGMLPAGLVDTPYSRLIIVDAEAGTDAAGSGTVRQPYKTLQYATRQLPHRRNAGTAYYLVPGDYGVTALDPGYSPGATNIAIRGSSAALTYIPELNIYTASSGVVRVTVELAGVRVGILRMQNNKPVTLRLSDGAGVGEINTSYASAFTVYRGPDNSVGVWGGTGVYSNALTHTAADIYYVNNGVYTNLWLAMDAALNSPSRAITAADTSRWNQAWSMAPTGVTAYAVAVNATNRIHTLENSTSAWNRISRLWSTNTFDGHVQYVDLEVREHTTNLVAYELTTVYEVQEWNWYLASWSYVDYDSGGGVYVMPFYAGSNLLVPGLPYLLSVAGMGNTAVVVGEIGEATVGAGDSFNGYLSGVGFESSGIGLVNDNPDYGASIFNWYYNDGISIPYGLYTGAGSLYRVDADPVAVTTTNEVARFVPPDVRVNHYADRLYAVTDPAEYVTVADGTATCYRVVMTPCWKVVVTELRDWADQLLYPSCVFYDLELHHAPIDNLPTTLFAEDTGYLGFLPVGVNNYGAWDYVNADSLVLTARNSGYTGNINLQWGTYALTNVVAVYASTAHVSNIVVQALLTSPAITGNVVVATSALVGPRQWLYLGVTNAIGTWRLGVDPVTTNLMFQMYNGTFWATNGVFEP